jgi:hypothetical protein
MKNLSRVIGLLVLPCLILTLTVTDGWAGARDHEDSFFLRLSTGAGYAKTSFEYGTLPEIEISGVTGDVNIAIGGMLTPNLALHGTLFGWSASDPDLTFGSLSGEVQGDVTTSAVGGGLTYYIMPINIYISGSVGIAVMNVETSLTGGETDNGVAVDFTLGKEWWVSDSWGLGIAGAFGYHSIPEKNIDEKWTGMSFGIRFTASYN